MPVAQHCWQYALTRLASLPSLHAAKPEHILLTSDLKFDPVWSLLKLQTPTGSSKYDALGGLLRAALDASPSGTGRYDPVGMLLKSQAFTAQAGRGTDGGTGDTPSPRVRSVSKYDMLGQAVSGLTSLPEDLKTGAFAARSGPDPIGSTIQRVAEAGPQDVLAAGRNAVDFLLVSPFKLVFDATTGAALQVAAAANALAANVSATSMTPESAGPALAGQEPTQAAAAPSDTGASTGSSFAKSKVVQTVVEPSGAVVYRFQVDKTKAAKAVPAPVVQAVKPELLEPVPVPVAEAKVSASSKAEVQQSAPEVAPEPQSAAVGQTTTPEALNAQAVRFDIRLGSNSSAVPPRVMQPGSVQDTLDKQAAGSCSSQANSFMGVQASSHAAEHAPGLAQVAEASSQQADAAGGASLLSATVAKEMLNLIMVLELSASTDKDDPGKA